MYANTKDKLAKISKAATAIAVLETVDASSSNRLFDEFAFQIAGRATKLINGTLLNGGFETAGGGGADVFANWTEAVAGTTAISQSSGAGEFHSGTKGCKIVLDVTHSAASVKQSVLTIGRTYTVKFWAKGVAGGEKLDVVNNTTVKAEVTLTTSWAQYSTTFIAAHAVVGIATANDAANNSATVYIDDVEVSDVNGFYRAPTDFTADLEVSMDGSNWTSIKQVTEADHGVVKFVVDILVNRFRVNVSAITTNDSTTDDVFVNVFAS